MFTRHSPNLMRQFAQTCIAGLVFFTAAIAADPLIIEVASARVVPDQRTGELVLTLGAREPKRFSKSEGEKHVARRAEVRIDGLAILRSVVREPLWGTSGLQVRGFPVDELEAVVRAVEAGSRVEMAIVD